MANTGITTFCEKYHLGFHAQRGTEKALIKVSNILLLAVDFRAILEQF